MNLNGCVKTSVLLVLALLSGCGTLPPQPHSSALPVTPSSLFRTSLSVKVLPVTMNASLGTPPTYPPTVSLEAPAIWAKDLAAYGLAGIVVIAPKGWTGYTELATDGSTSGNMQATAAASIPGSLEFDQSSACLGCSYDGAVTYFPALWPAAQKAGYGFGSRPSPPPRETFLNAHLVAYSLSALTNGVAETSLPEGSHWPFFQTEQVTLPPRDHGLATVILNFFITRTPGY